MLHFVARPRSQVRRSLSLGKAVQFALFFPLIGILLVPCSAQYNTGLPTVGNAGSPVDSQMLIDATRFLSGTDMCGAINTACSKLNATSTTYPAGATIDARGFTGTQVCAAANATKMLLQCVPDGSTHGATGGKLLLGNVNLYIDGPTGSNYTDTFGSGIGTPAILLPNGFWGIEGISRGAGDQGSKLGTFISACPTVNPPTGCSHAFPQRSFTILSVTVGWQYHDPVRLSVREFWSKHLSRRVGYGERQSGGARERYV